MLLRLRNLQAWQPCLVVLPWLRETPSPMVWWVPKQQPPQPASWMCGQLRATGRGLRRPMTGPGLCWCHLPCRPFEPQPPGLSVCWALRSPCRSARNQKRLPELSIPRGLAHGGTLGGVTCHHFSSAQPQPQSMIHSSVCSASLTQCCGQRR